MRRIGTLTLLFGCAALVACPAADQGAPDRAPQAKVARRVVSLNPSLTAMLLALGAGPQLVGVDDFSARQQPDVAALPRVGGLYDPSLEGVVALEPDLVVLVPSAAQRGFRERLDALGVPVLAVDPVSFDEIVETVELLGERVGRGAEARARAAAVREMRACVGAHVAGLAAVPAVLVVQRDPLYVAGAGSFVDDMLAIVGARNVAANITEAWPRTSVEWLIAVAPEVIVDSSRDPEPPTEFWSAWPSIPAVASGRLVAANSSITLPGPWLDRSLVKLLTAVRPDAAGSLACGDASTEPGPERSAGAHSDSGGAATAESSAAGHPEPGRSTRGPTT